MTHWGWYWKVKRQHRAKPLCHNQVSIDSFTFFKQSLPFSFILINREKNTIQINVNDKHLSVISSKKSYRIPFEKQHCNFGGSRYYFFCPNPDCNQRVRMLYNEGHLFACRKCLKLAYQSQNLATSHRLWLMENKISTNLTKLGGSIDEKPKWMRWKTFELLRDKAITYSLKGDEALAKECYDFYGVCV